ncbi:MAG TPA: hypothetical protein VI565_00115 [Burkholderiales bacterium]|nr:hypothetical protein [Burkholderiales bacterium]
MFTPAVALKDVGFVVWNEMSGDCGRIWVNRIANGVWSSAVEIGTTHAIDPRVSANANGDAIAVWTEREWSGANCTGAITGNEIWASRYAAASDTWSAPQRVSVDAPTNSTIYAFSAAVTLDAAGRATVAWIQDTPSFARSIWQSRFNSTTWSAPALLSNGTRNSHEPSLAEDAGGNVIAVWRQDTNPFDPSQTGGGPILPNIWAARYNATAGAWSTPVLIGSSNLAGFDGTERPRVAVNASGHAVAVWQETRGTETSIVAARFSASSGTWTSPIALEASAQQASWPEVAIDVNGNAQAVWVQKTDGSAVNNSGYTARLDAASGTWGAPQLFEQAVEEVSTPQVGMEDSGRALIAWNQSVSGTPPIHAVHYAPATGLDTPTHFAGDGLILAVNGGGTALLASHVTSFETTFFGMSIRAAMFRP